MALIKFSAIVQAAAGKIGGNVFARNKAGAYARGWSKPTTTPTISQTVNRARFGNQSAAWGALSAAQRDAWNSQAAGIEELNRLGDPYKPTGRQMFLKSNNNLAVAGETGLTAVPVDFVPPTIREDIDVVGTVAAGAIDTLDFAPTGVDATKVYVVEATGQMPDIKQNLTNVYRNIGTYAGSGALIPLSTDWSALYGTTAAVGNVIWFRIHTVDVANGMASPSIIVKTTLTV